MVDNVKIQCLSQIKILNSIMCNHLKWKWVQSKFKIEIFPDSLHLAGVVCYYGMHYSLFLRHSAKDIWIYLDDSIVKERIREQIHSKTVLLFGFFIRISRRIVFFVGVCSRFPRGQGMNLGLD